MILLHWVTSVHFNFPTLHTPRPELIDLTHRSSMSSSPRHITKILDFCSSRFLAFSFSCIFSVPYLDILVDLSNFRYILFAKRPTGFTDTLALFTVYRFLRVSSFCWYVRDPWLSTNHFSSYTHFPVFASAMQHSSPPNH